MRGAEVEVQQLGGVEICALPADGPVQVRASDAAGGAAQAQLLAAHDVLALADGNFTEVHVEREEPHPVVDEDAIARIVKRTGKHDDTAIAGADR